MITLISSKKLGVCNNMRYTVGKLFFTIHRVHSPATSSSNANDVVNYLEREAAEGSEADPSNNRPTSVTPTTDPRFIRSVSMTRSESGDFYNNSGGKSRQTASPLIPLEQLLQQDQVSGNLILIYTFSPCYFRII